MHGGCTCLVYNGWSCTAGCMHDCTSGLVLGCRADQQHMLASSLLCLEKEVVAVGVSRWWGCVCTWLQFLMATAHQGWGWAGAVQVLENGSVFSGVAGSLTARGQCARQVNHENTTVAPCVLSFMALARGMVTRHAHVCGCCVAWLFVPQ